MMTVHELAKYSGTSIKTLHHYDKIGLLKPCYIDKNGYRKYNDDSIRRLQQIMLYKEMDLPLKKIKDIIDHPSFDQKKAISDQKTYLTAEIKRTSKLVELLEQIQEGNNLTDFKVFEHNEFVKMQD